MKKMKFNTATFRCLLVAAPALLMCGCLKKGQQVEQTTNAEIKMELLFEKDGCKIYRFVDAGHAVYWTDCRGKVESVYSQSNGKSSHEERVQNQTIN